MKSLSETRLSGGTRLYIAKRRIEPNYNRASHFLTWIFSHIRIICISCNQIMKEVTQTLAPEKHHVMRDGQTTKVQIVPQMISSLRWELTFWEDSAGKS